MYDLTWDVFIIMTDICVLIISILSSYVGEKCEYWRVFFTIWKNNNELEY